MKSSNREGEASNVGYLEFEHILTSDELQAAYNLHLPQHKLSSCKRNCRTNPKCLSGMTCHPWFDSDFEYEDDPADTGLRSPGCFVGLENLGSTCYMNSLLQLWFHNIPLREAVYSWNPLEDKQELSRNKELKKMGMDAIHFEPVTSVGHLKQLFAEMQFGVKKSCQPHLFCNSLSIDADVQEDAQEVNKLYMQRLEEAFSGSSDKQAKYIIQDTFRGLYSYETRCSTCQQETKRRSYFYELELNVRGCKTVEDSLRVFLEDETLAGDNQIHCSKCKRKSSGTTHIQLKFLPTVLQLQLLRYKFDSTANITRKLHSSIYFPEILDMSPFLALPDKTLLYKLHAILMHNGNSTYAGHYYAHINTAKGWYLFDDVNVRKEKTLSLSNFGRKTKMDKKFSCGGEDGYLSSTTAYMLVYMRQMGEEGNRVSSSSDSEMDTSHELVDVNSMSISDINEIILGSVQGRTSTAEAKLTTDSSTGADVMDDGGKSCHRAINGGGAEDSGVSRTGGDHNYCTAEKVDSDCDDTKEGGAEPTCSRCTEYKGRHWDESAGCSTNQDVEEVHTLESFHDKDVKSRGEADKENIRKRVNTVVADTSLVKVKAVESKKEGVSANGRVVAKNGNLLAQKRRRPVSNDIIANDSDCGGSERKSRRIVSHSMKFLESFSYSWNPGSRKKSAAETVAETTGETAGDEQEGSRQNTQTGVDDDRSLGKRCGEQHAGEAQVNGHCEEAKAAVGGNSAPSHVELLTDLDKKHWESLPAYIRRSILLANQEYRKRNGKAQRVAETKQNRNKICDMWAACVGDSEAGPDGSEILEADWLRAWLKRPQAKPRPLDNSRLLCEHGKVCPSRVRHVKVVTKSGADVLYESWGGGPRLPIPSALCRTCVEFDFRKVEFNRNIRKLTALTKSSNQEPEEKFWIGKKSLLNFTAMADSEYFDKSDTYCQARIGNVLGIPKIKFESKSGGSDASACGQFNSDIVCPHGNLSSIDGDLLLVGLSAWNIIQKYFPDCREFKGNSVQCSLCQVHVV